MPVMSLDELVKVWHTRSHFPPENWEARGRHIPQKYLGTDSTFIPLTIDTDFTPSIDKYILQYYTMVCQCKSSAMGTLSLKVRGLWYSQNWIFQVFRNRHIAQAVPYGPCVTVLGALRVGMGSGHVFLGEGNSSVCALALKATLFPLWFSLVCLIPTHTYTHTHVHIMYGYTHTLCVQKCLLHLD